MLGRWIDRLEALPLAARAVLAWLVCLVPRALATASLGLVGDYRVFADPTARTQSWWYPFYRELAEGLWASSGGSVALFAAWQLALHAAVGPLVYGCCRRLGLSGGSAWFAVLGVALLPYYVSASARQPQVGVVIAFVVLVVWAFLGWRNSGFGWRGAIGFAALGATSTLIRPNLLLTVAALYALALAEHPPDPRERRAAAARILGSGLLVALALLGLAAAAKARTGAWSPFQPVAGYNLWLGHNPRVGEYLRRWDVLSVEDAVRDHGFPEEIEAIEDPYQRDRKFTQLALEYARSHPRETLVNTLVKAGRYWDFRMEDAEENPLLWNLAYTGPYLACLALGALGAAAMLRSGQGRALLLVAAVLVSYWIPHLVMFPTIRMRMTTEFLLIILAGHGLAVLLLRGEGRRGAVRQAPGP